ncbi:MAG: SDR family oxidoreductase [Gammaproteobacteria bacterium]|nr:SDR family oxidoreductase [Gammaproteobacteria bacterium]
MARLALAARGIRVNSVHPGAMATAMLQKGLDSFAAETPQRSPLDDLPISRAADPAEVANVVLFLASNESSYCTGSE